MEDDGKAVVAAFLIGVVLTAIIALLCWPDDSIESKTVIVPDTIVVTTNGISDTTFIYKEK